MIKCFAAFSGDMRFLFSVRMSPAVLKSHLLGMLVGKLTDIAWRVPVGEPVVSQSYKLYSYSVAPL